MPPAKFPAKVTLYVGDSRTWDLSGLTVDGEPVDLSDADRYRVSGSIRRNREPATPVTATLAVSFPAEPVGTVRVRLVPDEAELLRDLLDEAEPVEGTTALSVVAAIDVQVEVLDGADVVERTTLLSDDAVVSGDVTR